MRPALIVEVHCVSARLLKVIFALIVLGAALFSAPASRAEDLHYFKNYFVTGDYAVDGVGLFGKGVKGWATGTITPSDVPQGADIVAAYLYWETVETTPNPSSMNGYFDFDSNKKPYPIVGDVVGNPNTVPCWSSGGTGGPGTWLRVYRADVLRYLKVDPNGSVRDVDYTHTVTLSDSGGNGNGQPPHTEGASLVVVYRVLDGKTDYKAVVLYDGAFTMTKGSAAFSQAIGGFYDPSGTSARMTQIVGNGQPGFTATLTVNGATPSGVNGTPFVGAQGTRWDNLTFDISSLLKAGPSSILQTQVSTSSNQACLSWGAVVTSTKVINSDGDGLLDSWKTNGMHLNIGAPATTTTPSIPATFGGCSDYQNEPCENLPAMGALQGQKDIFVQIDWMQGIDGHTHSPKLAALQAIAGAFSAHQINVHFDVGNRYQTFATAANNYMIVPFGPAAAPYAQGGNFIQESSLACPSPDPAIMGETAAMCEYDTAQLGYSVLGWKTGIGAIENGFSLLGIKQYFQHDRKDLFHYILLAHALAGPIDVNTGLPVTPPPSVSGVGDLFGGDVMVTLGLWRTDNPANCVLDDSTGSVPDGNLCTDQTGTSLVQEGTIFHELGHNLGLHHGGGVDTPNCMVDYPSTMNYLYQTRGLTDALGNENIDYSKGTLLGLNENSLPGTLNLGSLPYRLRYYGPATGFEITSGANAKANCNGTFPASMSTPPSVRLETPGTLSNGTMVDWSNGTKIGGQAPGPFREDIDFDGTFGDSVAGGQGFMDHDDWGSLNLRQIGGRPNVSGLSVDVGPADISTTDLLGQSVLGQNVLGQNVLGQNVLGQSVLGQNVLGQSVLGQNVLGQNVLGQNVLGQNVLGQNVLGEIDYDTAISTLDATGASTPLVAGITASVPAFVPAAVPASVAANGNNQVTLNWGPPSLGQIVTYTIYRTNTDAGTAAMPMPVGTVSGATFTYNDVFTDFSPSDYGASPNCSNPGPTACFNTNYQYSITATDVHNTTSTPSNSVAANVEHLFITANNKLAVYGSTLPAFDATIVPAVYSGSVAPNCAPVTNGVAPPLPVGQYTIHCTVSSPIVIGADADVGVTFIDGTLTITALQLTVTATGVNKVYNGGTSATVTLSGNPLPSDSLTYSYASASFASKNAGTAIKVTVTGISISGTGAGNYTFNTTATTFANITPAPMVISATGVNKVYDGGTKATVILTDNRIQNVGDTFTDSYASATFATRNVGNGIVVSVTGITISGTGVGNYTFNTTAKASANITPHPLTITAQPNKKIYDGTTKAKAIPTVSGLVGGDTVTGLAETYNNASIGSGKTLTVSAYTINDGNSGKNYSVTKVANTNGVITDADGDFDNDSNSDSGE